MNRSERKLLQLRRLTELVYRQEAAKAASALGAHRNVLHEAESIAVLIDKDDDCSSFVHELALARLSRLGAQANAARVAAEDQLSATIEALSRRQGVETALVTERAEVARQQAQQVLEEIIDRVAAAPAKG
jgi:hypothetical protein